MSYNKQSGVIELNQHNFKGNQLSHPLLYNKKGMVVCSVGWCGYCKQLAPTYSKISKTLGNSFPLFYIDGDKYPEFVKKTLNVNSYPTIFYIDRTGKPYSKYNGERNEIAMMQDICKESQVCKRL